MFYLLPRPKTLGKIRQRKLVARDHLRALGNILSQMQLDLNMPLAPLRPVIPGEESRLKHEGRPYKWNHADGSSTWDNVCQDRDPCRPRLVISPDEGSPMFATFQYMAGKGCLIHLARDELLLGQHFLLATHVFFKLGSCGLAQAQAANALPQIDECDTWPETPPVCRLVSERQV